MSTGHRAPIRTTGQIQPPIPCRPSVPPPSICISTPPFLPQKRIRGTKRAIRFIDARRGREAAPLGVAPFWRAHMSLTARLCRVLAAVVGCLCVVVSAPALAGETCAGSHIEGSSFGNCGGGGGGTSGDDDEGEDDGDDPDYGPEDTADTWPAPPSCECGEPLPNHWNKSWSCTPTNVCAIEDFVDDHACPLAATAAMSLLPGGPAVRVALGAVGYSAGVAFCGG